jgi:hypothetical protein
MVQEPLDVGIDHPPPPLPPSRPDTLARLVGAAPGPKPEGDLGEPRLEDGLHDQLPGRLDDPITHARNAEMALPASAFGIVTRRTGSGR